MSDEFDYFDDPQTTVHVPSEPTYTRGDYQTTEENQSQDITDEYQQPVVQQTNDQYDAYLPQEVTPEMLEMRRKQEEIQARLQKKALDQKSLKEQRKQEGKQQLQRFKANRIKQIEKCKTENRALEKKPSLSTQNKNQWQKVVDNIALKEGERAGTKNLTRMKQALVRRSKDIIKQ